MDLRRSGAAAPVGSARGRFAIVLAIAVGAWLGVPAHAQQAGEEQLPEGGSRRVLTNRASPVSLPLPSEEETFLFAVFGDRTGGPRDGVEVLRQAVHDVNLIEPDLVMTVGDLIEGYNETGPWLEEMREFRGIMDGLKAPWFPVAGNHDVYWRRGADDAPPGQHDANYELHFGPLWYAYEHKGCWFIVLYTDEGDAATGRKGFNDPDLQRMSPEQFDWLQATLAQAADARHVFVFLHHPRWTGGHYGDDWERVHQLLVQAGNVTAVFAGHIHRMRYDPRDGIEYFTLATTGGWPTGDVPEAGYLHHYDLVLVREDHVAVATYPVGEVLDPRAITGDLSEQIGRLQRSFTPRPVAPLQLDGDYAFDGSLELGFTNPVDRPLEVTMAWEDAGDGWVVEPDHQHWKLQAGEQTSVRFELRRAPGAIGSMRRPTASLDVEYLAEAARIPLPRRTWSPELRADVPPPEVPDTEHVLALDGVAGRVAVADSALELPSGPLTLECWLKPTALEGRRGLVTKTENSEFGLFVNDGVPSFLIHLGDAYVIVAATDALVGDGRWVHLAGEFDGASARLYVDGQLVGHEPGEGDRTANDLPLLVGADVTPGGGFMSPFEGLVDEVRLSSVARYAGVDFTPARRFDRDEHTHLLLHFDGARGPFVFDASPTGSHGWIHPGATIAPER